MKKVFFVLISALTFTIVQAQGKFSNSGQTDKGKWLIEANTGINAGIGEIGLLQHTSNTGFGLYSVDGETVWKVGAEAGYFVMDDLAIKAGLGYTDIDGDVNIFSYKIGAKYYAVKQIPLQIDINGASIKDSDENPLWLGLQGGYAIFIGDMVSIEPGLRYSISMNEDFTDKNIFEARIGFAVHL